MNLTKNTWAITLVYFAYILIIGNFLCALIYPFAGEAYLKMHPVVNNFLPIMGRTVIFVLNAIAGVLILRQYFSPALLIFALNSAIIFLDMAYTREITLSVFIFSFWDFLILTTLVFFLKKHDSKQNILE